MWNIVSLSTLLIVVQATDIHDFYGNWTGVAFYPVSAYVPRCINYEFSKSTENVQCTYADGSNATLVDVLMMTKYEFMRAPRPTPMTVVDTPAEVMPALNKSCKFGDEESREYTVVRLVNENFFLLFHNIPAYRKSTRTETEPNGVVLYARNVVSEKKLLEVMASIEDLKGRQGAVMCVTENIDS